MNSGLQTSSKPSSILWLWVPVVILIVQICVEIFVPVEFLPEMHTEGGPIETLQFVFMVLACLLGAYLLITAKNSFMKIWLAILLAGSIYIAGEEVSWGQHIFEWYTPEFWSSVNDQNETNLHNTSSWLDQKPRALLIIGMVVGGLIFPLLRRFKPAVLPQKFSNIYPQDYMVVTALGVIGPYLVQEISDVFFGVDLFHRVSEVQELYMYYFILLYLWGLKKSGISQV